MYKLIKLIFCLFSFTISFGQDKGKPKPFILQGQITEFTYHHLFLTYESANGISTVDTIHVSNDGRFFFKTNKIESPLEANFNNNSLFVAPGYNLTITANGKDRLSFYKSKKISGVGSESNKYLFLLDSIAVANIETKSWFDLDEINVVKYVQSRKRLRDSLAHIIFNKKAVNDKFINFFGRVSLLDNTFEQLNILVSYLTFKVADRTRYANFINQHFNKDVLKDLFKEEYLLSSAYKDLVKDQYVDYLVMIDYGKDSTLRKRKGYNLEKISQTYKGKAREYVLYSKIKGLITYSKSFKELSENKKIIEPYFSAFSNGFYKNALEERIAKIETQLKATQVGMPAPSFSLESNLGTKHSLKDFKGKVVYLDLWASWCHPCRDETPYLKELNEKYSGRNDIALISVSIDESPDRWKKALEEDKPTWLQLIDKENLVWASYVANVIPQFVIIDKKGNIVNFDAPRPSDNLTLEKILNQELAK